MKFDPDSDYQKHRDAQGGVWFIQEGRKFSVRGKDLGEADPVKKSLNQRKEEVRARASEKLKDYSEREVSGSVAEALKENRAAVAAEEHVE